MMMVMIKLGMNMGRRKTCDFISRAKRAANNRDGRRYRKSVDSCMRRANAQGDATYLVQKPLSGLVAYNS
jgi:hypothetical protein